MIKRGDVSAGDAPATEVVNPELVMALMRIRRLLEEAEYYCSHPERCAKETIGPNSGSAPSNLIERNPDGSTRRIVAILG